MINDPGGGDQNLVLTYWEQVPFDVGEELEYLALIHQLDRVPINKPTEESLLTKRTYPTSFGVDLTEKQGDPPILKRVNRRSNGFNY